ncbi:MAG TPA: DUF192 domain-containing protein [Sphingobium sp.]|nr:DUF192 domain-containing protein [Sphingobium sp.]
MKVGPSLLVGALLAGCSAQKPADKPADHGVSVSPAQAQHLRKISLLIRHGERAPDGRLIVEIALTPEQQERGLMHRTDLKPGDGMLFPMLPPRMPSFWMKDTPASLDILFIRMDGGVEKIIAGTKPGDRTPLFAEIPVAGVLELPAGEAQALALDEGDRISWGACIEERRPARVTAPDNFCPG